MKYQLAVVTAPPYQPPRRCPLRIEVELVPTHGPGEYEWEAAFELDPVEEPTPPESSPLAIDNATRAPRRAPLTWLELGAAPPATRFQPSDGIQLSEDGRVAKHRMNTDLRQAILSTDWVCKDHPAQRREWRVQATVARYNYGDIYFGITEASSFEHAGRTIVFDVQGNFRIGWHPLNLVQMHRASDLDRVPGVGRKGVFRGAKDDDVSVVADLAQGLLVLTIGDSVIEYPIVGFSVARLCVSMGSARDVIALK